MVSLSRAGSGSNADQSVGSNDSEMSDDDDSEGDDIRSSAVAGGILRQLWEGMPAEARTTVSA
jgi:hypothetical protein